MRSFRIRVCRVPPEKSCKSVVSPYILLLTSYFLFGHSEGSEKYRLVGIGGGGVHGGAGGAWWTALAHGLDSQQPEACFIMYRTHNLFRYSADHPQTQTRSQDETVAPDYIDQMSVFSGSGQTPPTSTPLPMWPTSVSVASQKI